MATLTVTDNRVQLSLSAREKLAALHGDMSVPLSAVSGVTLERDPVAAVSGLRAPGLAIPGRTKIGTWRSHAHRSFVVARDGDPAVRIMLSGVDADEWLVSTPGAERVVAELAARLGRA